MCTVHSPPAIFPISLFASLLSTLVHLCICVSLTFTLTMRHVKGLTHTHQAFIPHWCCHTISCSLCHLSVIYCYFFSPLCLSVFHTKWACFAWRQIRIPKSLTLTQGLLTSTSVSWEFLICMSTVKMSILEHWCLHASTCTNRSNEHEAV